MCAQFLIKARVDELKKKFGILVPTELDQLELLDERVLPYKQAVVVTFENGAHTLKKMAFSLIPSWSKEKKVKFATHNARVETVTEKPTWKGPFKSKRVIVPLTHFIEPIYLNSLAGNMVQFHQKDHSILAAAGIYDSWFDPETKETTNSFAIVTTTPPAFVDSVGHDRCPIFLKESAYDEWLNPKSNDPAVLLRLLKNEEMQLDLSVDIDRPLAKGWEKRIPT